jgi:hypothetical protein
MLSGRGSIPSLVVAVTIGALMNYTMPDSAIVISIVVVAVVLLFVLGFDLVSGLLTKRLGRPFYTLDLGLAEPMAHQWVLDAGDRRLPRQIFTGEVTPQCCKDCGARRIVGEVDGTAFTLFEGTRNVRAGWQLGLWMRVIRCEPERQRDDGALTANS